ncbi:hypothetical protein IKE83_01670 [Candidatus Saccharibacteria bacterium]|nr:hypothetical protein [Candidatus Saccharibacteria bacterium]
MERNTTDKTDGLRYDNGRSVVDDGRSVVDDGRSVVDEGRMEKGEAEHNKDGATGHGEGGVGRSNDASARNNEMNYGHEINLATKKNVRRFGLGLKDRKIAGWVFGAFGTVIVGLVVAIAVVNINNGQQNQDMVGKCIFGGESKTECNEYVVELQAKASGSGDDTERTMSAIDLTTIYSYENTSDAIRYLNDFYEKNENLDDQDRYYILNGLLNLYTDENNKNGQIQILNELLKLPDDMVLEAENWREVVKPLFEVQLAKLEES